jgi:hypothetical protein
MPSADDVLIAAIELVLTGAELPEAGTLPNGHTPGTGFVAASVAGAAHPRAAVTWYEDGKPTGGPDGLAGKLRDCERALRRAGSGSSTRQWARPGAWLPRGRPFA